MKIKKLAGLFDPAFHRTEKPLTMTGIDLMSSRIQIAADYETAVITFTLKTEGDNLKCRGIHIEPKNGASVEETFRTIQKEKAEELQKSIRLTKKLSKQVTDEVARTLWDELDNTGPERTKMIQNAITLPRSLVQKDSKQEEKHADAGTDRQNK